MLAIIMMAAMTLNLTIPCADIADVTVHDDLVLLEFQAASPLLVTVKRNETIYATRAHVINEDITLDPGTYTIDATRLNTTCLNHTITITEHTIGDRLYETLFMWTQRHLPWCFAALLLILTSILVWRR